MGTADSLHTPCSLHHAPSPTALLTCHVLLFGRRVRDRSGGSQVHNVSKGPAGGWGAEARTKKGSPPLHLAAKKGHTKTAHMLLNAKADVNLGNGKLEMTALHLAAKRGFVETAKILLQANADVELKDKKKRRYQLSPRAHHGCTTLNLSPFIVNLNLVTQIETH